MVKVSVDAVELGAPEVVARGLEAWFAVDKLQQTLTAPDNEGFSVEDQLAILLIVAKSTHCPLHTGQVIPPRGPHDGPSGRCVDALPQVHLALGRGPDRGARPTPDPLG